MVTKEKILKSLADLPDSASVDDVIDRVMLLEKIEIGLQQSEAGKTISLDEAKKRHSKWLKSK